MPLALLVLIDLGMRLVGLVSPDDPRTFYFKTHDQRFSPFVEDRRGQLTINSDWVAAGNNPRVLEGTRPGRLYVPPGFRPCRIARSKPADTIRIFALGGSTTFGLFLEPEAAFSAVLERQLRKVAGHRRVEVLNLGCLGWASDRVAGVLDALTELQPDLVIVYSGHNELLQGHCASSPNPNSRDKLRAILVANSTILGWINHAMISLRPSSEYEMARKEMEAQKTGYVMVYDPLAVPGFEPRLLRRVFVDEAVSKYGRNVHSMITKARAADVPILFCLPVGNLLNPPAVSAHADGFAREDEFQVLLERMLKDVNSGRFDQAMADLARAAELSPRYALVHYWRGLILMDRGQWEAALVEFRRARDCDGRAYRITSRLEKKLTDTIKVAGGRLVDPRPRFHEEMRIQGNQTLFLDRCHPSPLGHQLIADALLPVVLKLLGIDGDGAASSNHPD